MKAFVFMADVLVAILVSSLILVSITSIVTSDLSDYNTYYLSKTAQDTLTLLDKSGILKESFSYESADAAFLSELNASLTASLPQNVGVNLTIQKFYCIEVNDACANFVENASGRFNVLYKNNFKQDSFVVSKRVFIHRARNLGSFDFGVSTLEVWFA